MFDTTCLVYTHDHTEGNPHKNSGAALLIAGRARRLATGMHTKITGTIGDLYLALADEVMQAQVGKFPTASRKLTQLLA